MQAAPGQAAQDLMDRLGRFVAFDRTDEPLEHASVKGESEARNAEHGDPGGRLPSKAVAGDLRVERALERVEAEDDQGRHDDPGRFGAGRVPGHPGQLERVEPVPSAHFRAAASGTACLVRRRGSVAH